LVFGQVPPAFQIARKRKDNLADSASRGDGRFTTYASLSNSVRYLGAGAFTFSMNAACSSSFSFGGGVVRVATGSGCAVETREFRGTPSASNRVFPQPARALHAVSSMMRIAFPDQQFSV
jgi:hypothetical protein